MINYELLKRGFDFVVAVVLLILSLIPVLLVEFDVREMMIFFW